MLVLSGCFTGCLSERSWVFSGCHLGTTKIHLGRSQRSSAQLDFRPISSNHPITALGTVRHLSWEAAAPLSASGLAGGNVLSVGPVSATGLGEWPPWGKNCGNPMRRQTSLCSRAGEWAGRALPMGLSAPMPASSAGSNGREKLRAPRLSPPPTPQLHIQPSLGVRLGSSPHLHNQAPAFILWAPSTSTGHSPKVSSPVKLCSGCFLSRRCWEGAEVRRCLYRQELWPLPATDHALCLAGKN